jgi:hypothetical protein
MARWWRTLRIKGFMIIYGSADIRMGESCCTYGWDEAYIQDLASVAHSCKHLILSAVTPRFLNMYLKLTLRMCAYISFYFSISNKSRNFIYEATDALHKPLFV